MSITINTTGASLAAQQQRRATSMNRLSSGTRVDSAAGGAARFVTPENLQAKLRSLSAAGMNANDGISMTQVADSGLNQISDKLNRMRELAVQGSNAALDATDRGYLNAEFTALREDVDRVAQGTQFNGKSLLAISDNDISLKVGAGSTDAPINLSFSDFSVHGLGLDGATVEGADTATSEASLTAIDDALRVVSTERAGYGAAMNRLTAAVENNARAASDLEKTSTRIRDADAAEETAVFAKMQILSQVDRTMLAQANQTSQVVLGLLR